MAKKLWRDMSVSEKIAEADTRGNQWLSKGNDFSERGLKDKAEECYRKGNFWLDKSNILRGEC
ncbi:hypothetical protein ACYPKM_00880 [Pseudomonas aeruginosa]